MGFLSRIALALSATAIGVSFGSPVPADQYDSSPIVVTPGGPSDIIITKYNTINGSNVPPPSSGGFHTEATANLQISLVNLLQTGSVTAYVIGTDLSGRAVLLQNNGQYLYASAQQGNPTPQQVVGDVGIQLGAYGTTKTITLPDYISSGRVYLAVGTLKFYTLYGATGPTLVYPSVLNPSDPNAGVSFGIIELTNLPPSSTSNGGIYSNLSFVDFVGLVLGISLKTTDGRTLTAKGLKAASVQPICNAVVYAGKVDKQPWGKLCMTDSSGNALRVLSPQNYLSGNNPTRFNAYWTSYVDQVFAKYTDTTLIVDTQVASIGYGGKIGCHTVNGALSCAGDNHVYSKPIANDIYGCNSGPFATSADDNDVHKAVVARLCAAFNRATLLLNGGSTQPSLPPTNYYTQEPANLYARMVHAYSIDGRGYAFPYDDVTPTGGQDQSGSLADASPLALIIYVGGQQ